MKKRKVQKIKSLGSGGKGVRVIVWGDFIKKKNKSYKKNTNKTDRLGLEHD